MSSIVSYAQLTAKVGETTTLSVEEVSSDTYVWELYDSSQGIDFAKTAGNCPSEKAIFIGGNTGNSVKVKWLAEGTYFYKVTARNSCTNNIKIGKITIGKGEEPPAPTVPKIIVTYNCDDETATLKATNYSGNLLWSTGEISETITVSKQGTYTLIQKVGNKQSSPATITVENIKRPKAPDVSSPFIYVDLGEKITLMAEGCPNGTILWYSDEELTQKIESTTFTVSKKGTYDYYAVCQNEKGCRSPYTKVTVVADRCSELFKNMKIPQGFSPNGDGINEKWSIKDLKDYCERCDKEAKVIIYNRWGNKVYEQDRYMLNKQEFDGYAKGKNIVKKEFKLPFPNISDIKSIKILFFYRERHFIMVISMHNIVLSLS